MNSKKLKRIIEISKALLPKSDLRCSHFTFILKKGKILSIGQNSNKTNPKNLKYNYKSKDGTDIRKMVGCHSEMAAIIKYGQDNCSDCVFINLRIDNNGELKISKPCNGCMNLLNQVGYKKIIYSSNAGDFLSIK